MPQNRIPQLLSQERAPFLRLGGAFSQSPVITPSASAVLLGVLGLMLAALIFLTPEPSVPFVLAGLISLIIAFLIPDRIFLLAFLVTPVVWNIPVGSGVLSRFYLGNFIFAIAVLRWFWARIKFRTYIPKIGAPLTFLCGLAVASLLASVLMSDPAITYQYPNTYVPRQLIVLAELALILSIWFAPRLSAGFSQLTDRQSTWSALYIGATICTVPVILSSVLGTGEQSILGHLRPASTQYWYGVAALPFMVNDLFRFRRWRPALVAGIVLIGAAAYLSFSRQIWVWVAIAISVPLLWRNRRRRIFTFATIVLSVAFLVGAGAGQFFDPARVYGLERTNYYVEAISLFARHPLLGVGAGNYQFFSLADANAMQGGIAHNQLLTLLAEFGMLVLPLLTWLVFALILLFRSVPAEYKPAAYGFLLAWFSSWFATETAFPSAAAGGGAGVSLYVVFMWFIVGLLSASAQGPRSARPERASSREQLHAGT